MGNELLDGLKNHKRTSIRRCTAKFVQKYFGWVIDTYHLPGIK